MRMKAPLGKLSAQVRYTHTRREREKEKRERKKEAGIPGG